MVSADTLQLLIDQGIQGHALVAIVRSMEADKGPAKTSAAERQRRYRERVKAAETGDVTEDVTRDVTERDATPAPSPSFPSNSQTNPTHTPGNNTRTRKGTRLPVDFSLPDDWLEWSMAERGWTRLDAESEGDAFCDHWRAKPGTAATKLDWQATWRNWTRNSRRSGRNGQRASNHGGSPGQHPGGRTGAALDSVFGSMGPS